MKSFENRVAVVTGAGSGIGRQVALQLAAAGAGVALLDLNASALEETAGLVRNRSGRCWAYPTDVSDPSAVELVAKQVKADAGRVDILVNNAGIMIGSRRFDAVPPEDERLLFDVNLWGVIHCTRAFLPHLLEAPEASIVNVSSLGGLVGMLEQVPYATVKHAVRGFSESLQMDLYETPVRVTAVYPGPVDTPMILNSPTQTPEEKRIAQRGSEGVRKTSAEAAAAAILAGIRRRKARVLIGPEVRAMDLIVRLAPASHAHLLYRPMKKMLATLRTRGADHG